MESTAFRQSQTLGLPTGAQARIDLLMRTDTRKKFQHLATITQVTIAATWVIFFLPIKTLGL